jgi:hypothetical protein
MLGVEMLSSFWISRYYNLDFRTFCMILHLKHSENFFSVFGKHPIVRNILVDVEGTLFL